MTEKTSNKAVGMENYSDIEPMNREQAAYRRKRSIAIASVLGFLVVMFYITTITRLAENVKKQQALRKKAADISIIHPAQEKFALLGLVNGLPL